MSILGIDTSNYRTSICLINHEYQVLQEQNPILQVKQGEVGLQQSVAVFQHLKVWPSLLSQFPQTERIEAIGVSTRPRPVEESYMPVFKVGEVLAETLAHFLSVPLYKTSHQEGHIAAGEFSMVNRPIDETFLAVHLSGGTSEILQCSRLKTGYAIEKLGGTLDLHAGQFVDRVGVELGLPFPSGPHLEKLAKSLTVLEQEELPSIPSYEKNMDFSFSGPTTAALRLIQSAHYSPAQLARAVENTISKTLEKALLSAMSRTNVKEIMLVGGVASNQYITQRLIKRLEHPRVGATVFLASPQYATDNAYGVACLALNHYKSEQKVNDN